MAACREPATEQLKMLKSATATTCLMHQNNKLASLSFRNLKLCHCRATDKANHNSNFRKSIKGYSRGSQVIINLTPLLAGMCLSLVSQWTVMARQVPRPAPKPTSPRTTRGWTITSQGSNLLKSYNLPQISRILKRSARSHPCPSWASRYHRSYTITNQWAQQGSTREARPICREGQGISSSITRLQHPRKGANSNCPHNSKCNITTILSQATATHNSRLSIQRDHLIRTR